jgi:hypothetical protein
MKGPASDVDHALVVARRDGRWERPGAQGHDRGARIAGGSTAAKRLVSMLSIFVVLVASACSGPKAPQEIYAIPKKTESSMTERFSCAKRDQRGGPWRQCAPTSLRGQMCAGVGCFERETAFCFPTLFFDTGEVWTNCTASEKECEEWNADRKTVLNKSMGPCVESRPDEYILLPTDPSVTKEGHFTCLRKSDDLAVCKGWFSVEDCEAKGGCSHRRTAFCFKFKSQYAYCATTPADCELRSKNLEESGPIAIPCSEMDLGQYLMNNRAW